MRNESPKCSSKRNPKQYRKNSLQTTKKEPKIKTITNLKGDKGKMITMILVKILQWLGVSVILNYEIHGTIKARTNTARIYNNDLRDGTQILDSNGKRVHVQEGKFHYEYEATI